MEVKKFYLNALSKRRRDVYQNILDLHNHVQSNSGTTVLSNSAQPAEFYPTDIAGFVLHHVNALRGDANFMNQINDLLYSFAYDHSPDIILTRNRAIVMASEYIQSQNASSDLDTCSIRLSFRTYLLNFLTRLGQSGTLADTDVKNMKASVSMPSMVRIRGYLEYQAQVYGLMYIETYAHFLAIACTLLLRMAHSGESTSIFQVAGEVENVIYKYSIEMLT